MPSKMSKQLSAAESNELENMNSRKAEVTHEQRKAQLTHEPIATIDERLRQLIEKRDMPGAKLTRNEQKLLSRYQDKVEVLEKSCKEQQDNAVEKVGDCIDCETEQNHVFDALELAFTLENSPDAQPREKGDEAVCHGFTMRTCNNVVLFDEASLTVLQGRRYGFMGPNGQGKTTLMRHLSERKFIGVPSTWDVLLVEQEAQPVKGRSVLEEVLAAHKELIQLQEEEARLINELENLPEEQFAEKADYMQELCDKVSDISDKIRAIGGAGGQEARAKVILSGLGFSEDMIMETLDPLSGGWRMRVSLAKALLIRPKLLLLDEPTNHLDLDAVMWLVEYLQDYPHAAVIVSHDASFLEEACTDMIELQNRKLHQSRGGYRQFCKARDDRKDQQAKEVEKLEKRLKELKAKGQQKGNKNGEGEKDINQLKQQTQQEISRQKKELETYVVKFPFDGLQLDADETLMSIEDGEFIYPSMQHVLLKDMNFSFDGGSRCALVGPNGAGKSTLLRILRGELALTKGRFQKGRFFHVAHYHQHFEQLLEMDDTPIQYLQRMSNNKLKEQEAHQRLSAFNLKGGGNGTKSHTHHTRIRDLSGGQKARVAFAALTIKQPHVLILDEPTNHLDLESVEGLIDALREYPGAVVVISHNARLLQGISCRLFVLKRVEPEKGNRSSVVLEKWCPHEDTDEAFKKYKVFVHKQIEERNRLIEEEGRRREQESQQRKRDALEEKKRKINAAKECKTDAPMAKVPNSQLAIASNEDAGLGLVTDSQASLHDTSSALPKPEIMEGQKSAAPASREKKQRLPTSDNHAKAPADCRGLMGCHAPQMSPVQAHAHSGQPSAAYTEMLKLKKAAVEWLQQVETGLMAKEEFVQRISNWPSAGDACQVQVS